MSDHDILSELKNNLPGVSVTLPTLGHFYDPEMFNGEIDYSEFMVQPFSLWSEMRFRDFSAIMSGQATKELLATVAPQIKDYSKLASVDVEMIMAASRKVAYGDDLKIEVTCTSEAKDDAGEFACREKTTFMVNLSQLIASYPILDREKLADWRVDLPAKDGNVIKVFLMLPTYENTLRALKIFVEQKQSQILVETGEYENLTDDDKTRLNEQASDNYIKLNILNAVSSIQKIELPSGTVVSDQKLIEEMISSKYFSHSWLHMITEKVDTLTAPFKNCGTHSVKCPHCNHVIKDIPVVGSDSFFFSADSQE